VVGLRANRIRIEVGVRKTGVRNRDGKAFVEFLPCRRRSFSELGEILGEVLAWSDDRKEQKAGVVFDRPK
jgi:hypothetical protein